MLSMLLNIYLNVSINSADPLQEVAEEALEEYLRSQKRDLHCPNLIFSRSGASLTTPTGQCVVRTRAMLLLQSDSTCPTGHAASFSDPLRPCVQSRSPTSSRCRGAERRPRTMFWRARPRTCIAIRRRPCGSSCGSWAMRPSSSSRRAPACVSGNRAGRGVALLRAPEDSGRGKEDSDGTWARPGVSGA
jgi:hypothetical protein